MCADLYALRLQLCGLFAVEGGPDCGEALQVLQTELTELTRAVGDIRIVKPWLMSPDLEPIE